MPTKTIYFDNSSTTRPYSDILTTYSRVVTEYFANPSSVHKEGAKSFRLLEEARKQVTDLFQLPDHSAIFTSGATEANNLAIKGYCLKHKNRGNHIITSVAEHSSVLECFKQLEEQFGFQVTYLPINEKGFVEPSQVFSSIKEDTIFVSLMAVNNETGAITDVETIARELKKYKKIAFHVDAVQAIGKIDINYKDVDFITIAGHKIHALNGCGLLIKRKNISLLPLLSGGGQEDGLRSGTNDVALAATMAKALRISLLNNKEEYQKMFILSNELKSFLAQHKDLFLLNSMMDFPYIVNFSTLTRKAAVVVEALSNLNIMVSSTSACNSKGEEGSYVVKAMGRDDKASHNTVRVSFSYENTLEEVKEFEKALLSIIQEIKQ